MPSATRPASTVPSRVSTRSPARPSLVTPRHRGVLVDAHPRLQAGPAQPPGQPGRIEHEARVAVPHPAQVGGRGDLGPDLRGVQHLYVVAERACRLGVGVQPGELPRCHRDHQLAGPLGRAVDPVAGDGVGDLVQVRHAEPVQLRDLGREPGPAVAQPVGQGRRAEAAVTAGRGPPDSPAFQQHHVGRRVALLGQQGGPQPGEPAADHGQPGRGGPAQRRLRRRSARLVQPVGHRPRARQGGGWDGGRRPPGRPASGTPPATRR